MHRRLILAALALMLLAPLCPAQDTDTPAVKTEQSPKADKEKKGKKAKKELHAIAKAVKECKFISGRPSVKAKYYIYASVPQGADTVAAELKELVTLHKALKKDKKADIIFISGDTKASDAKKVLSKAKAKFAAALADEEGISSLPGFKLSDKGLRCVLVDTKGNCVRSGSVADMSKWEEAIAAHERAIENAATFDEAPANTAMAQCLKKMKFLSDVRPNLEAKYFIFLCSASWCGPCNAEMPKIVQYYADMQLDPRVCLILIDCDKTEDAARAYMNKYGVTFPAIMRGDPQASAIPGMSGSPGIPWCWFITADGKQLFNGHGSNIRDWKNKCDTADTAN